MFPVVRMAAAGALALATVAPAWANVPSRSQARTAAKQLEKNKHTLADIIKAAEAQTGGKAVAVGLERAPADHAPGSNDRSQDVQDQNQRQNSQDVTGDDKLEYRVTCLVGDSRLKDAYVCAETAKVKTVRNANEHSRWTRGGTDRDSMNQAWNRDGNRDTMNRSGNTGGGMTDVSEQYDDRHGSDLDRFAAGPDGHYERIWAWRFVPNNGGDQYNSRGQFDDRRSISDSRYADPNDRYTGDAPRRDYLYNDDNANRADRNADEQNRAGSINNDDRTMNDRNRDSHNADRANRSHLDDDRTRNPNQPGHIELGSHILGASVTNPQNEDLGDVDDVVIDPNNSKIVYTAVSYGGVLGIGEKRFAVPCHEVNRVTKDQVVVDIAKSEFENNPGFENNQWPKQADSRLATNGAPAAAPASNIKKLSEVIGKPLKSQQNEQLGTIDDVAVDTGNGQIAYLIVDSDASDGLVAVPCAAVTMQNDKCVINLTKDRFNQLETFKADNYPMWTNMGWNERTHSSFNVEPYWRTNARSKTTDTNSSPRTAG